MINREALKKEELSRYILEKSEFLKMPKICELANVNYQVFRNWKRDQEKFKMSIETMQRIIDVIKKISD